MTSPDQRASDKDRNEAVKLVEAAVAAGRIIPADRDKRVPELRQAQTMQDIDLILGDLRPVSHTQQVLPGMATATAGAMSVPAGTTPTPSAQQPWPLVNYGPTPGGSDELTQFVGAAGKAGKKIGGIIAVIVLVSFIVPIAGVAIAFFSARDSLPGPFTEPSDETTYLPGQEPGENGINLHYVDGYLALEEAVRAETGSTEVYQLVLYPRYAVLDIPVPGGEGRYQSFYYDGELQSQNIKSTTTYELFDMADFDPALIVELLEKVRAAVDDPESWYVIVTGVPELGTQISAFASNEFGESEYIIMGVDGTVVYDTTTD